MASSQEFLPSAMFCCEGKEGSSLCLGTKQMPLQSSSARLYAVREQKAILALTRSEKN